MPSLLHCDRTKLFLFAFFLNGVATASVLDDDKSEFTAPNYEQHVKPVLRQHCLKCHGDEKQESDLNMQSFESLLQGGSGGKIVIAGRASQSRLLRIITDPDDDARMPPNSPPIAKEKVEVIRQWIESGLKRTAGGKSLAMARKFEFKPNPDAGAKPVGAAAMPLNYATISVPRVTRPFPVLATTTSPWAQVVAIAGQDHVQLVHTETKQMLGRLAFPEGEPHVIRFSHDGLLLLVAGGRPVESGSVVLFDVRTGARRAIIGDELDTVIAADLSPDQQLVALGGSGRVVKVFSTTTGNLKYKLTKHTDWITAVAFSPDGKSLATADRAGGIHLWETKSGGISLNLAEHKAAVHSLDWRSDSQILASSGEDGRIIWWDVQDGFPAINKPNAHPPTRPPGTFGAIPNGVLSVSFDRHGNLLTSGRDGVVRLWSADGQFKKQFQVKTGIPISNSVSHDGKTAIVGDSKGNVHYFEIE